MALWIGNPQNILASNSGIQLPLMNGWWSRVGIVVNTNIYPGPNVLPGVTHNITTGSQNAPPITINDGLLPGNNIYIETLVGGRLGNSNKTITLQGGTGLSSHEVTDDTLFPLGYFVSASTELTFSVSAIGTINNGESSVCSVAIVWIDSADHEISRNIKSLRCPFGEKLRVAITAVAPVGTIRCILQISAAQTCIVSSATLAYGDMIVSNNDINYLQENELFLPTISGDRWYGNTTNLIPVEPFLGGPARMYGWRDYTNALVAPSNAILTIPIATTYSLNYAESIDTTTFLGIDILPNTPYVFSIAETGTSPAILLEFYDSSGTALITTVTVPPFSSVRRVASFTSPVAATSMVIVATGGIASATLSSPSLVQGTGGDPGPLPPTYIGTFAVALDVPWANHQLVANQLLVASSNRGLFDSALDVVGSNNQLTTKTVDVQYPNRTTARANLDVGYANNTLAKSSLDISYSLNAVFTKTLDARWNDLQVFAKSIDLLYANRALVTCALDIANPNNALFNSSIISRTPNNCVVLISQDFAWANRQLTTNLLDLTYATNQTFHRNLDVVYDLRQLVHKDVQFIWGINRKPSIV